MFDIQTAEVSSICIHLSEALKENYTCTSRQHEQFDVEQRLFYTMPTGYGLTTDNDTHDPVSLRGLSESRWTWPPIPSIATTTPTSTSPKTFCQLPLGKTDCMY
jgi:hypothetical protein